MNKALLGKWFPKIETTDENNVMSSTKLSEAIRGSKVIKLRDHFHTFERIERPKI